MDKDHIRRLNDLFGKVFGLLHCGGSPFAFSDVDQAAFIKQGIPFFIADDMIMIFRPKCGSIGAFGFRLKSGDNTGLYDFALELLARGRLT